jgi:hypothetical protein
VKTAAAIATVVQKDDLLRFALKTYQPRAAPLLPTREREPAVPQSIKDAIVRWLDEQL